MMGLRKYDTTSAKLRKPPLTMKWIEPQRNVSISHLAKTRDTRKLFDTINPQSARTTRGIVAGTAESKCVIVLSPYFIDGIDHVCRVLYLNGERIVMKLLTRFVAEDLKRNIEQLHC